jgi:hypothetical protein
MHTPGPWEIAQFGDDGNGFIGHQIWSRAGGEVCAIRIAVNQHHDAQYDDFTARCEANARLIAAAPALLEALKKIVNNWGNLHPKDRQQARIAIEEAK